MTLKLQYRCTDAEMKDAKTLQEYDFYGRGSKWRGRVVLGGLVALAAVGTAIRFKREIAPQNTERSQSADDLSALDSLLRSQAVCGNYITTR